MDAAIADEYAAFFHNHGGRSDGAFQPTALEDSDDASGFDRGTELAFDGELIGFDGMRAVDLGFALDDDRARADAAGAGFLHGQARLALAVEVTIENPLDARTAAHDPRIPDDAFGAKLEVTACVHRTRDAFVDADIDELDRRVATGADRALGFLRDLMRAAALETMNWLALTGFFSGKGRQGRFTASTDLVRGSDFVMSAAGTAVGRDEVGRLELHKTALRAPKRCLRRCGRHGALGGAFDGGGVGAGSEAAGLGGSNL